MSIGDNIKRLRNERGLTQEELALKCGLSRSYIADLERNRYSPSLKTLKIIAGGLGVDINSILGSKGQIIKFATPEEAMEFLLKQPAIMGFGGFDIEKMTDDEIMDFANELLRQLELISYKYKK